MKGDQSQWVLWRPRGDASYSADKTSLVLTNAELSMTDKDGKHLALVAPHAKLALSGNHVSSANLSGGLTAHYGDFILTTEEATFSPDSDQIDASGLVKIDGQGLSVSGTGLSGHPKAESFELLKQVTTRILPRQAVQIPKFPDHASKAPRAGCSHFEKSPPRGGLCGANADAPVRRVRLRSIIVALTMTTLAVILTVLAPNPDALAQADSMSVTSAVHETTPPTGEVTVEPAVPAPSASPQPAPASTATDATGASTVNSSPAAVTGPPSTGLPSANARRAQTRGGTLRCKKSRRKKRREPKLTGPSRTKSSDSKGANGSPFGGFEASSNRGPINIQSDTLALDYKNTTTTFRGHVHATQAGSELTCNTLDGQAWQGLP